MRFNADFLLVSAKLPTIIIAKDILSFLSPQDGAGLLREFSEKLTPEGVLIVGDNERIPGAGWAVHEASGIRWYTKTA